MRDVQVQMLTALVVLLLVAGAYFAGRLLWVVVGGSWIVFKNTRRARIELRRKVASLTTEDIRTRLVQEGYFTEDLRRQATIQQFLSRITDHDEIALAAEYPRGKLYRMLATAEQAAGRRSGRPEAVDSIEEIFALLDTLARRTSQITAGAGD